MSKRGKFITLEGMDGAGKSSHIPLILSLLQQKGIEVISTREPGGTPLGEKLRELLLHEEMMATTESLLMFAARQEHIAQVIEPALQRGAWVLSDRFTDASYAYQCGGRGIAYDKIAQLENWVQQGLQPDATLLFDVPVAVSVARLADARLPDKFEAQPAEFFEKIRATYLTRAQENPQRFYIINSNQPFNQVQADVQTVINAL